MWLFTTIGFFSVVEKPVDGTISDVPMLVVRARVAGDLDALRDQYMPQLGTTLITPGGDYGFRAAVTHEDFSAGLARLGSDIHYSNFKSEVWRKQGRERASIYEEIWRVGMLLRTAKVKNG
jgi:hypothetical protein